MLSTEKIVLQMFEEVLVFTIYIVKFSLPSKWSQSSLAVLVISFYYYEITYYSLDLWLLLKTIGVGRLKYVFVHEVIFPNIYILLSIIYYVPPLTIINSLVTILVVSKARQTLSNFIEIHYGNIKESTWFLLDFL